jgi:alpha-methylacyl-CoA racemase
MSGPLAGVKIIELAGIGPGPYACMLLADMGADVLRIERGEIDSPPEPTGDILNRSRPSVSVNLKTTAGKDLVLELCEQADILVEGFRPGVTERLGLGPDDVWQRNPRMVYGRMTGYGQEGTLARRAGHDINYISLSGALWSIGREGERPVPPLNLVGDFGGGGMLLALGVVAALLSARITGEGQIVDAAMVDGAASMMAMTHSFMNQGTWVEERGVNILDTGAPFYEVYETKDHKYVAVGALEAKFYSELLRGLELQESDLPAQHDYEEWAEMKVRFQRIFLKKDRDEWTAIFSDTDACVTPVLSPREAALHPYNVEREVFLTRGAIQPNPVPRFSKTPAAIQSHAHAAGSDTRSALRSWGIDEQRLLLLESVGAFGGENNEAS